MKLSYTFYTLISLTILFITSPIYSLAQNADPQDPNLNLPKFDPCDLFAASLDSINKEFDSFSKNLDNADLDTLKSRLKLHSSNLSSSFNLANQFFQSCNKNCCKMPVAQPAPILNPPVDPASNTPPPLPVKIILPDPVDGPSDR